MICPLRRFFRDPVPPSVASFRWSHCLPCPALPCPDLSWPPLPLPLALPCLALPGVRSSRGGDSVARICLSLLEIPGRSTGRRARCWHTMMRGIRIWMYVFASRTKPPVNRGWVMIVSGSEFPVPPWMITFFRSSAVDREIGSVRERRFSVVLNLKCGFPSASSDGSHAKYLA